jgi:hypothetical protein
MIIYFRGARAPGEFHSCGCESESIAGVMQTHLFKAAFRSISSLFGVGRRGGGGGRRV